MESVTYVVQQPYSATNPTARHRVVSVEAWLRYVDGIDAVLDVAGSFDTYAEAQAYRDELNGKESDHVEAT